MSSDLHQILYASSSSALPGKADLAGILEQSRHNNAIDGITGLLCSDDTRFLQVLEGPPESVAATFARIRADERHHDIKLVLNRSIAAREFGTWTMAHRRTGAAAEEYDEQLHRVLDNASDAVRAPFLSLIE